MFTDTHTHLYLDEFENGGTDAVRRAIDNGVGHMIFPNVDISTIKPMKSLAAIFPGHTFMAMGLHPTEIKGTEDEALSVIEHELFHTHTYIAVGEIGMDLYWDKTFREQQMQAFEKQVAWAVKLGVPVIIHCREALDETIEVLSEFKGQNLHGVFHSFGGTCDEVDRIRSSVGDFYFGINGIVTFKNCKVRNTLPAIGIDRLLLETDSPYLAPVPHRGKRNESAYLIHTAAFVSQATGTDIETLSAVTTDNASHLFGI